MWFHSFTICEQPKRLQHHILAMNYAFVNFISNHSFHWAHFKKIMMAFRESAVDAVPIFFLIYKTSACSSQYFQTAAIKHRNLSLTTTTLSFSRHLLMEALDYKYKSQNWTGTETKCTWNRTSNLFAKADEIFEISNRKICDTNNLTR